MATPNFNLPPPSPDVEPGTGMGMGISPGRSTEPDKLTADIWSVVAEYLPEEDQIKLRTVEGAEKATESSLNRERVKTKAEIEKDFADLKKDLVPFLETVINHLTQIKNPNPGYVYNPTPENLSLYKDQISKLKYSLLGNIEFRKPTDLKHLKSSINEFNNDLFVILDQIQPEHLSTLNIENMPASLSKIKDTLLLMNEIKTALETRAPLDERKALYNRAIALEVPFLAERISTARYSDDLPELIKLWASIGSTSKVNEMSRYVSRNAIEDYSRIKGAAIAGYILRGNHKDTIFSYDFRPDPFVDKSEIYLNMIKSYLANNQPEEAWRLVKEVGTGYSVLYAEDIREIFNYYFAKDPQLAIQFFNQLDKNARHISYARSLLAPKIMDYYLEQEKSEEKAIQFFEKELPDTALSLNLVKYYLINEKYDKAIQLAESVQKLTSEKGDTTYAAHNFNLIFTHFLLKNMIEEAALALKKAIYTPTYGIREQTDKILSELLKANKPQAALDLINEAPYFKNETSYRNDCYIKVLWKCLDMNDHDLAIEIVQKLPEKERNAYYRTIYDDYMRKEVDRTKKLDFRDKLLKLTDDLPRLGFWF